MSRTNMPIKIMSKLRVLMTAERHFVAVNNRPYCFYHIDDNMQNLRQSANSNYQADLTHVILQY